MTIIYCARSRTSVKSYVGQTTRALDVRWGEHRYSAKNGRSKMARAIKKYGANDFDVCVLEECSGELTAIREMYWIAQLNTLNAGYNSTEGGAGGRREWTMEQRQIMSDIQKYVFATTDVRSKISASLRGKVPWNKGLKGLPGRKHTDEAKQKISAVRRRLAGRCVLQFTRAGIFIERFETVYDTAQKTGASPSAIVQCCRARIKSSGGYIWRYGEV